MSKSGLDPDVLSSVAEHAHAGNRSMARLTLDPTLPGLGNHASSWLWKAWLAESPDDARWALQTANELDRNNEVIAAGLTFVQGLLDWKPPSFETDFDVDPEFLVDEDADLDDRESVIDHDVASDPSADAVLGGATDARAPESDLDQPSILVVDDSETVRNIISLALSTAGYESMTAADGAAALQMITDRRPTLVLCDTSLPKLDGYTLCKLIKKHKSTHDVPVILLSEKGGVAEWMRTSMAGCRDYIAKPFEAKTLIEMVRRHACPNQEPEQSDDC